VETCASTFSTEIFSPEVAALGPQVENPVFMFNQLHCDDYSTAATQILYHNGSISFHADPLLPFRPQIWGDTLLFEQELTNGAFITYNNGADMEQPQSQFAHSHPRVPRIGWCPNPERAFPCNDQAMIPVSVIHLLRLRSA
jgi:hypothetical protein